MEPFLVLFAGVVAGGCLVMFFCPQAAFRPVDDDVPAQTIGRARWMFLGLSFTMLAQGVGAAGGLSGISAGVRFTLATVLLVAGVAAMAWGHRGMSRLKQERLNMMRERKAAELAAIQTRQDH